MVFPISTRAQNNSVDPTVKLVSLDEFTIHSGTLQKKKRKSQSQEFLEFLPNRDGDRGWDSTYFLTSFSAIGNSPVKLTSVQGRLADFDTSQFEVCLTVLQFREGDTLFKTVPVKLSSGRRLKQKFTLNLNDQDIVLRPGPFFLGYGFHVKTISERISYRLYAATGGDGLVKSIRGGKSKYRDQSFLPNSFPFTIGYLQF